MQAKARVNLKDLVYSSLQAITDANMQISNNMIETINEVSDNTGHDEHGNPIVQLKNIQMVYDQMRHDDTDTLCTEKIGLKIPLLSLLPLSSLKISRSKIKFSTEVQEVSSQEGHVEIYTKVSSPNSARSNNTSRIDFEIELESDPVAEGLSRIIDQLSQNFIPKVLDKEPLDSKGNVLSNEAKELYRKKRNLRKQERKLLRQIEQVNERIRMSKGEETLSLDKSKQQLEQELANIKDSLFELEVIK